MNLWKHVLVALDPFAYEPGLSSEKVARAVRVFAASDTCVEAVHVLNPRTVGVPVDKFVEHQEYFRKLATELMRPALAPFREEASAKVSILPRVFRSLRASVRAFLSHAEETGADLLVVGTHARKGVDRLFLGSFAETVLLTAELPVLVVNPSSHWNAAKEHILFATDFSEASQEVFRRILPMAKARGTRITLFHQLTPESAFVSPMGFLAVQEWRANKAQCETNAIALQDVGKKAGVDVDCDVATGSRSISDGIVEAAEKKNATLVVLATNHCSAISAIGGVPRQVVRAAPCPVLLWPMEVELGSDS